MIFPLKSNEIIGIIEKLVTHSKKILLNSHIKKAVYASKEPLLWLGPEDLRIGGSGSRTIIFIDEAGWDEADILLLRVAIEKTVAGIRESIPTAVI